MTAARGAYVWADAPPVHECHALDERGVCHSDLRFACCRSCPLWAARFLAGLTPSGDEGASC